MKARLLSSEFKMKMTAVNIYLASQNWTESWEIAKCNIFKETNLKQWLEGPFIFLWKSNKALSVDSLVNTYAQMTVNLLLISEVILQPSEFYILKV